MFIEFVLALFVILIFHNCYWKRRNLPRGPCPLPIVGNLLTIAWHSPGYDAHLSWTKKYGPVYTVWLGNLPVVCVSKYSAIKESFIDDAEKYVDRYRHEAIISVARGGIYGVVDADGELWREQRRFVLRTFKNFGMGKNLMEKRILEEVDHMLSSIKNDISTNDQINVKNYFEVASASIINNILFGTRFEKSNLQDLYDVKTSLAKCIHLFMHPSLIIAATFPNTVGKLPYFRGYIDQLMKHAGVMFGYFDRQIEKHEQIFDPNAVDEEGVDFVDVYLKEIYKMKDKEGHYFTKQQLRNLCLDLWAGAFENIANTFAWSVLYLIHKPEVQRKVHKELDEIITSDRFVFTEDRVQMHYMNAFICEVQRVSNLLPQINLRTVGKEVIVNNCKIPKGTVVAPQISCVLYDEDVFPDPLKFKPERFLDAAEKFKKIDELIPFSVGKRQCLGEGLAKMEMFLVIANICNHFEFKPIDSSNLPTLKKRIGITMSPQPFECKVISRI